MDVPTANRDVLNGKGSKFEIDTPSKDCMLKESESDMDTQPVKNYIAPE